MLAPAECEQHPVHEKLALVIPTLSEAENIGGLLDHVRRVLDPLNIPYEIIVVDDAYRCVGLITVKDIEKAQKYPNACKDERGRLRVAAATGARPADPCARSLRKPASWA